MTTRFPISTTLLLAVLATGCRRDEPAAERAPANPPPAAAPAPAPTPPQPGGEPRAVPTPRELPSGTLYTVQVGAFVEGGNARRLSGRLEEAGLPVWAPEATVGGRAFDRVRVGVTPDPAEARRLATLLQERYGGDVWLTTVVARDALPSGALDATRRALEGRGG